MPTHAEGLGLTVSSPCEADWESMAGNEEVRFCTHCEKSVHDLSAMTRKDALRFVRANAGGVCVRFYSDPNGRTLHANEGRLHRITRRASRVAAGAFGAAVALGSTVLAQTPAPEDRQEVASLRVPPRVNASLTGTVLDPNGSLVAGAGVTVINRETGDVRTATTNAEGVYYFELIPPGAYRVEFEAEGFGPASVNKVELQPGVEWRQDSMLAVRSADDAQAEESEEAAEEEEEAEADEGESCATEASGESKAGESKQGESKPEAAAGQEVSLRPEGERRPAIMGMVRVVRPEDPLVKAVYERDARAAKNLIALGANVNVLDRATQTTALIQAVSNGDAEIVSELISAGADVNMKDTDGDTALTSINGATVEMVRELIAAGAKVNHKNNSGATPLIVAAENDEPEVLKELLESGARVAAKSKDGRTALMAAAQYGMLANARVLLDAGADVNARDNDGNTALRFASDMLAGTIDAEAQAEESPKSKGAKESKDSEEVAELKKLVALLVSYGAVE